MPLLRALFDNAAAVVDFEGEGVDEREARLHKVGAGKGADSGQVTILFELRRKRS